MARVLDNWPDIERRRSKLRPWLDGQIHELRHGEDFESKPGTLRSGLQAQAKRLGGRARTRHVVRNGHDFVVVQFLTDR